MKAIAYFAAISLLAIACTACTQTPPEVQTRIVEVPSSKPYRYIRFSSSDDPKTISEIKRHNRAHSAVIAAEKKARQGK